MATESRNSMSKLEIQMTIIDSRLQIRRFLFLAGNYVASMKLYNNVNKLHTRKTVPNSIAFGPVDIQSRWEKNNTMSYGCPCGLSLTTRCSLRNDCSILLKMNDINSNDMECVTIAVNYSWHFILKRTMSLSLFHSPSMSFLFFRRRTRRISSHRNSRSQSFGLMWQVIRPPEAAAVYMTWPSAPANCYPLARYVASARLPPSSMQMFK